MEKWNLRRSVMMGVPVSMMMEPGTTARRIPIAQVGFPVFLNRGTDATINV
jgi:hypothetical protein